MAGDSGPEAKLHHCPFCGVHAALRTIAFRGRDQRWIQVVCATGRDGCGASGPRIRVGDSVPLGENEIAGAIGCWPAAEQFAGTKAAVAVWNQRASGMAELERLRLALQGSDRVWLERLRSRFARLLAPSRN